MLDITSEVRAKIAEKNIDLTDAVLKVGAAGRRNRDQG